jgi:hypothetical protein
MDLSKILMRSIKYVIPFILVLLIEIIRDKIIKKVFLVPNTRILALDNFKIYNISLFISFIFDCFMGFVSAIFRMIKSSLISIIMMPRISYGFIGRLFENFDDAFEAYRGFLHMESSKFS